MDALSALQSLGLGSKAEGPDGKKLLQQAQQVWSMLDDMADKDPKAYQRFIEKQKKEFEEANAPPKTHMCVRTKYQSGDGDTLYVNLMSWQRVPKPKTDQDSIALFSAPVDTYQDKKTKERVLTIAITVNPEVLAEYGVECKNNADRNSFINLALDYVEHLSGHSVDRNFFVLPRSSVEFKGDLEKAQKFFMDALQKRKNKEGGSNDNTAADLDVPEALMSKLASIAKTTNSDNQTRNSTCPKAMVNQHTSAVSEVFPETRKKPASRKNLIQEIESEEVKLATPQYSLEKSPTGEQLVLRVQLPGVTSVSDCQLDISEDDVKLFVEGKYDLTVKLDFRIDEAEATAKFSKKQSALTLHMPILNS